MSRGVAKRKRNGGRRGLHGVVAALGLAVIVTGMLAAEPPVDVSKTGIGKADRFAVTTKEHAGRDWWAFQPVRRAEPAAVKDAKWCNGEIDRFILGTLESRGLTHAAAADRRTLARRVYFGLTGLPPSPEEIESFVADPDPKAYEKLVDRLLDSPHYGERWARHWLDVARYTESQGFEYDHLRPNAWHYRDYVVKAFNSDMPYDRFVREQIAGDVIAPVTADGIVAAGLLVCGPWDQAGSSQANEMQRLRTREEELEDLLSVVGQSFLGVTLNCARCHDHKFDPIPATDYYRIKSVFEGVKHGERNIENRDAVTEKAAAERAAKLASLGKRLGEIESAARGEAAKRGGGAAKAQLIAAAPKPLARWSFDAGLRDLAGGLHGVAEGGARTEGGMLKLGGNAAFVGTPSITQDITEKTLEAWVSLPTLDQSGGGVITLEQNGGTTFDSIVFAERERRMWMAGSDHFRRTVSLSATAETAGPGELVHVAITYRTDGTITFYRNGKVLGTPYKPNVGLQTYKAGAAHVLFGKRHTGGGGSTLKGEIARAALYDRALSDAEIAASFAAAGLGVSEEQMLAVMSDQQRAERLDLRKQIDAMQQRTIAAPSNFTSYVGVRVQPPPTHVLLRGDPGSPADVVAPGALSAVTQLSPEFNLAPEAPEAQRRIALAKWITDPQNPLPARVIVNRLWHYHFGRGIVATPNDFGFNGTRPSHPQLLDWLASELVQSGWSLKHVQRLIVNSSTYRQAATPNSAASEIDADDALLWRYPPRRLEAEAVRDAMLAASGQINLAVGGPSFKPMTITTFGSSFYRPTDPIGAEFNRRTIYRVNVNSGKSPLLDTLDCPDPSVKTPVRRATITPLQALALMNDPFVRRQAAALAERAQADVGKAAELDSAVDRAYQLSLGRPVTGEERGNATQFARENGLAELCWILFNSSEFLYVR